jgi:hypothetical protein
VTFHLKSVQVPGVGMSVDEVQFLSSELLPAAGVQSAILCSRLVQPAVTTIVATIAEKGVRRRLSG